MLKMTDHLRSVLIASGALTTDKDGDEIFSGLTVAESIFFLAFSQCLLDNRDPAEELLYDQLQERHLAARMSTSLSK